MRRIRRTRRRGAFPGVAAMGAALALLGCAAAPPRAPDQAVVGPRRVIALVPDDAGRVAIGAAAAAEGYRLLGTVDLDGLDLVMVTFETPPDVTGAAAIAALEAAVPASTVGVNHAYRLQQAGGAQALEYADAMMRWPAGGCRALAPVGIIDTGVDEASPALAQARIVARDFVGGGNGGARHGAEVAAVLSSPGRLRAPTIFAANVFGRDAELGLVAGADALVRALDWMAQMDARFINLALAGPYNKLLDLAVDRAADRGLILVAAVGNAGPDAGPLYPAGFDGVIAVTAVDVAGRLYRDAVRGPHVDVAAPGVDVLVRSGDGFRFVTGTSIATPFVTARLAADPSLADARDVAAVRARLASTSAELGPRGRDDAFGYGLALAEGLCGP